MSSAYLQDADLTGAMTAYGGQGLDFTTLTQAQRASLIAQASAKIDGFLRDTVAETSVQEYYRGTGTNFLRLRHYPLWAGLQTTLNGAVAKGATSLVLASATGVLVGQYLVFGDGLETAIAVASSYVAGSTTVPLAGATQAAHAGGAAVQINTIDFINIVLPGQSLFPLPIDQLVVELQQGTVQNYTPLMFQQLGYSTIFPKDIPLVAQYTYGYPSGSYPSAVTQTCLELCISTLARNIALADSGATQRRVGAEHVSYNWLLPELTPDQKDRLMPWRRGRGFY